MPPRSKNGSTISSQVSLSTLDGGGSVAPALRHSSSQTPEDQGEHDDRRHDVAGDGLGSRERARRERRLPRCDRQHLGRRGVGKLTAVSVLRTGMFISVLLQLR